MHNILVLSLVDHLSLIDFESESSTCSAAAMASTFKLDDIQSALDDFKNGAFLLVVDDMDRENEGDLIIAGSKVTTAQMAFLIKHSRYVSSVRKHERKLILVHTRY